MARRRASHSPEPPPTYYTAPTLPTAPPHPKKVRKAAKAAEKREVLVDGAEGNEYTLWGERWNVGKLLYTFWHAGNPTQLWAVTELQAGADALGGECDGLIDCSLSSGEAWPGDSRIRTWWYPGLAAGEVNPNIAAAHEAAVQSWAEALPGTCYGVTLYQDWGGFWKKFDPVVWHYRGKKCLIPETQTFAYSIKSFDQTYSYLRYQRGKNLSAAEVDTQAFINAKAADAAAGRVYESHLSLMGDEADPDDIIEMLRLLTDSWIFPDENGRYTVVPDRPGAPTAEIRETHVSSSIKTKIGHMFDVRERPNSVTVFYTDLTNNRSLVPGPKVMTPAAADGLVKEVPIEYKVPDVYDPARAQKIATYQLNCHQYDLRVNERWNVKAELLPIGTIVDRVLEKRGGRHFVSRLLKRTKLPNNTSDVELLHHDNAKFSAAVVALPAKVPSTSPQMRGDPPNVALAGVTWQIELFQDASLNWLPRGILTFTPPANFPFFDSLDVWVSINGGPSRWWFNAGSSPARTPQLWEPGVYTLVLKTRHSITSTLSSGTTVAVLVTGTTTAPEVVNVGTTATTRWWDAPQVRSANLYAAGYWASSGLTGFNAALVNNGDVSAVAFTAPNPSGPYSYLIFDAGAGQTRNFCELTLVYDGAIGDIGIVQTSTDGVSWSNVAGRFARKNHSTAGYPTLSRAWAPTGGRRFFRVPLCGVTVREVHLAEYLGEFPGVHHYNVYDSSIDPPALVQTVLAAERPTVDKPLNVPAHFDTRGSGGSNVLVTAVSPAGESIGVESFKFITGGALGGIADFLPQAITEAALASGRNGNVVLPWGPGVVRFTATGSAYLDGISDALDSVPGRTAIVVAVNGTGTTLTVAHASGYALSATLQIYTMTGADVRIPNGALFVLVRDPSAARWRLLHTQYLTPTFAGGLDVDGENSAITYDALGLKRFGWAKEAGLFVEMRYDQAFSHRMCRISGSVASPTFKQTVLDLRSDGRVDISQGLMVGGGTAVITRLFKGGVGYDPPSIAAGDRAQANINISDIAVGDLVLSLSHTSNTSASIAFNGEVTAAGVLTLNMHNTNPSSSTNLASGTLTYLIARCA